MGKVILMAEDDTKSLKLIRDLFGVFGYSIIEATDGKRAIELAKTKKPDLILMDIQLPVMNGIEATMMIKADATIRDIPVIAVTANAMRGDEERVFQAGCSEYITKPINIQTLLQTVDKYLSSSTSIAKIAQKRGRNEKS